MNSEIVEVVGCLHYLEGESPQDDLKFEVCEGLGPHLR